MHSKFLIDLKREFNAGYYTKGTIINFFWRAPLEELKEGYDFIFKAYEKDSVNKKETNPKSLEKRIKEMVLFCIGESDFIKERAFSQIPELKE